MSRISQLSLAIGKEGQNARLAAKLTGWRIDIKSASAAEAERLAKAEPLPEVEEGAVAEEPQPAELPALEEPVLASAQVAAAPLQPADTTLVPPEPFLEPQVKLEAPKLRFAEDVLVFAPTKPVAKLRKKKKKDTHERGGDESVRGKKRRQKVGPLDEEEEY